MSAEDLARGIAALEDDRVRTAVAGGDLSAAGVLDLTDEERALLQAAADDEADVVGFGIHTSLLGFGPGTNKVGAITQDVTVNKAKTADKAAQAMDAYIRS